MIHTDSFAFIHLQKTGGMSMARYLVNALDDPVTSFSAKKSHQSTYNMAITQDRLSKLNCIEGDRHASPLEAISMMRKYDLRIPPWAFVVIRHPADLMLSYYNHLQKPKVWKHRGMTKDTVRGHVKVALENSFEKFCDSIMFYGKNDDELSLFFDKGEFSEFFVVPLSRAGDFTTNKFGGNANFSGVTLEHHNKSDNCLTIDQVDPSVRLKICKKYPKTLRVYEEACLTNW